MDRIADCFTDTYGQARAKFLAAVATGGARLLSSHTHTAKGPDGEDCMTDVAWLGPKNARRSWSRRRADLRIQLQTSIRSGSAMRAAMPFSTQGQTNATNQIFESRIGSGGADQCR